MALAATVRSLTHSTANATSYATGPSFTPTANSLLVAWIYSTGDATAVPGVTGNGLTWALVKAVSVAASGRVECWAALTGATPSAGVQTAGTWGAARTGCHIVVVEVTNSAVSSIAAAILQSPTNAATALSLSILLSAAGSANNRPMAFFAHNMNELVTPRTNWTELDDAGYNTPSSSSETQWRSDAFETSASASWTTSVACAGIAIELVSTPVTITGAAALSGTGTSTIVGFRTRLGAAALSGSGSSTIVGVRTRLGTAALTGTGSSTIAGTRTRLGAAALAGIGSSTSAGSHTAFAAASLSGTGSAVVAAIRTRLGAAALSGTGSSTVAGTHTALGAASLVGSGASTVTGFLTQAGAAALTGTGTLTAGGVRVRLGAAALTGTGSLSASGVRQRLAGAALVGTGSMSATGGLKAFGSAHLTGSSSLVAIGFHVGFGVAALTGSSSATVAGLVNPRDITTAPGRPSGGWGAGPPDGGDFEVGKPEPAWRT